jgi:hypothetical protein
MLLQITHVESVLFVIATRQVRNYGSSRSTGCSGNFFRRVMITVISKIIVSCRHSVRLREHFSLAVILTVMRTYPIVNISETCR